MIVFDEARARQIIAECLPDARIPDDLDVSAELNRAIAQGEAVRAIDNMQLTSADRTNQADSLGKALTDMLLVVDSLGRDGDLEVARLLRLEPERFERFIDDVRWTQEATVAIHTERGRRTNTGPRQTIVNVLAQLYVRITGNEPASIWGNSDSPFLQLVITVLECWDNAAESHKYSCISQNTLRKEINKILKTRKDLAQ